MLLLVVSMVGFVGCKEKTTEEKVEDKVEEGKKAAEEGKKDAAEAVEKITK